MPEDYELPHPKRPGELYRVKYRPTGEHVRLVDVDDDDGTETFWIGQHQLACKGKCAPRERWHDIYFGIQEVGIHLQGEAHAICRDCFHAQIGETQIIGPATPGRA